MNRRRANLLIASDIMNCRKTDRLTASDFMNRRRANQLTASDFMNCRRTDRLTASDFMNRRRANQLTASDFMNCRRADRLTASGFMNCRRTDRLTALRLCLDIEFQFKQTPWGQQQRLSFVGNVLSPYMWQRFLISKGPLIWECGIADLVRFGPVDQESNYKLFLWLKDKSL
jgi:hypothetical protein